MARAHLYRPVVDNQGNIQLTCTVRVLVAGTDPATNTLVPVSMYAGISGGSPIANPIAVTGGYISFFLDSPSYVQLGITVGALPEAFFDYVPVTGLGDSTASLHVGVGSNSTQVGDSAIANGTNSVALGHAALADQGNDTALGANAHASGTGGTAIGASAVSDFDRSVALGFQADTTAQDQGFVTVQELRLHSLGAGPDTYLTLTDTAGVLWKIGVDTSGHLVATVTT